MLRKNTPYESIPYDPCNNKPQRLPEHNPSPLGEGFFFVPVRSTYGSQILQFVTHSSLIGSRLGIEECLGG